MKDFVFAMMFAQCTLYAATKKLDVISSFAARECPDSVTFSWLEKPNEKSTVKFVRIQRRIAGAIEEEAWENVGPIVRGGVENFTVEGFSLDNSYEYRAIAITEVSE